MEEKDKDIRALNTLLLELTEQNNAIGRERDKYKELSRFLYTVLSDLQRQIPNDETLADFDFDLCEIAEQKYKALNLTNNPVKDN